MTPSFAAADLARYLALALVWTLAGRGILSVAGQRDLGATGWLLAPTVTQALVAVALGMSAVLGAPIHTVSSPLWIAVLGLAAAGLAFELIRNGKGTVTSGPGLVLAIGVIVPAVAFLPYFVHGFGTYQATTHPDAWSYAGFSAYLWEYQWSANHSGTRFVASGSLGWLATATQEGDTQAAYGLLLVLASFVIGTSCAAVGRVLGLSNRLVLLVAIGGGAGNWIANAIFVSNLDNLLALPYLPGLAALGSEESPTEPRGKAFVVGLVAAGAIYTYPEFAFVALGLSVAYFVSWPFKLAARQSLHAVLICVVTAGVLTLPYIAELALFLQRQLASGVASASPRPGEGAFNGLLELDRRPAALWALGPEDSARPIEWLTTVPAAILSVLALVGLGRLVRDRPIGPSVTIALLTAGFGVFAWHYDYSYGAYKFILLGWWLLVVAVAFGVRECSKVHPLAAGVALMVATATFSVSLGKSVRDARVLPQSDMVDFRALSVVGRLADGEPVAIAVGENTAAHWATYFLRGARTRLVSSSGYLAAPGFQASMARSMPIPWESVRLLLTDATDGGPFIEQQHWKRLWGNRHYTLWDGGDVGWAVVSKIDNGYPYAAGPNLVWIGDKPVTITAVANVAGIARIHADLGLSQPLPLAIGPVRLLAEDGAGAKCEWTVEAGGPSMLLGLQPGDNVLTLTKRWPVKVYVLPDADQRHPFMVGLVKPTLEFSRGVPNASYCPQ